MVKIQWVKIELENALERIQRIKILATIKVQHVKYIYIYEDVVRHCAFVPFDN
jgi:hypothetical protein